MMDVKKVNLITMLSVTGMEKRRRFIIAMISAVCYAAVIAGCSPAYDLASGAVKGSMWAVKTTYKVTAGTVKTIYKIGEFTYEVVKAPFDWDMTNEDLETIDGLPVKEAIRLGRVKNSPYTVKGRRYYPMSVKESMRYREQGIASWYGYETQRKKGGFMTANGEAFKPEGLTAAHKHLPLPVYVRVTNLENSRSIIVRVNDRGPFPSINNRKSGDRIIDLSMGAAKKLGFYRKGTARVFVETVQVKM